MNYFREYWVNRTLCSMIEDGRSIVKSLMEHSKSKHQLLCLMSLLEEIQVAGNRMEAGLEDKKDMFRLRDEIKKLKKERDKIRKKLKAIKEKGELNDDED